MVLASFAMLYPLLWMIASSFKPDTIIFSELGLWPSEWKFTNYSDGWDALRVTFTTFYINSFVIAILSVIGNLIACSLTAYAFARLEFRFKNLWFALMLGTLMLPYHVTLVPQYVLFLNIGWVDTILPLVVPKFLAHDAFFIFLMVQFFRGIPRELDEAARMDGCGPWRIYWRIMLPLSTTSRPSPCRWRCAASSTAPASPPGASCSRCRRCRCCRCSCSSSSSRSSSSRASPPRR
jgi:multiple sugar transport system permease protein